MNKAYSNKALPMGTVLREWRIEEVLGVGGFGIVYKARGIYFNELVAIKEYFPSSISERDSSDTVVPIDSDAEEVHALGLKKFVEEAKLLWNLSTPTRHPNIVSVRSLFEIHGTAYMVMDFEDGVSLSKMIKQGRRFNERSLWNILRPIAEGLERAHRVGVLHRDIKPPNILINEDNRPVLIDFGSARFDTAEATSTKVTFHTPPYAAIEQYVKTYAQGPWTDIYALGVVMYECVTGEKPPEVLERLHAGLGKPLAAGKWPGYSKRFLGAVDAAMIVKPEERPQSLTDWLEMFGKNAGQATDEADEDATRFYAQQVEAEQIVPVPPTPNGDQKAAVETGVPADPKQARFKRAGEETGAGKRAARETAAESDEAAPVEAGKKSRSADAGAAPPAAKVGGTPAHAAPRRKMPRMPVMAGAAVAVLAVLGLGGYMLTGGSAPDGNGTEAIGTAPDDSAATVASLDAAEAQMGGGDVTNVAGAGAPPEAGQPDVQAAAMEALRAEKAKNAAAEAKLAAIKKEAAKKAVAQPGASTSSHTADRRSVAEASSNSAGSEGAGVSQAKLSQFYSIVDDARSMAKKVSRSRNSQNAALAKSYDANLKTLRDSMRGISSDREADRLIKQASQTRAYVQFLAKQQ
jgi:tRNA A-37 threonylcarbamoyl transferase component Bud32